MPTYVIRYEHQGARRWGVVRDDHILPIPGTFESTGGFLRAVDPRDLANLDGDPIAKVDVNVRSPVTRNQQFVCQGANYRQHMIESGVDPNSKTFNMIFTKASSCIVAADSPVVRPKQVAYLDYELELGLIIGRPITGPLEITRATLHEFVAGIVIVNDYSARDIQIPQMQFYKGKSFRTFGPVGPYLCLLEADEVDALHELDLTLTVNGEVRQHDNTRNLVYAPAETLTELSGLQDFAVGDLLATGTPAGCALSIPSPFIQRLAGLLPEALKWRLFLNAQARRSQYLKPGDVVEASIRSPDGRIDLGTQRNVIEAAP
ncbi:MAG: fumarylacetoacetate hydrolase family protein [Myxococcota bacterium]